MSSDLIQQLQQLQRGFSALPASPEAADALFDGAQALKSACSRYEPLAEPADVTSAMTALLQQMVPLDRKMASAAEHTGHMAAQFGAACVAIRGCARLSDRLPLGPNDLFRLGSSLALVFGTGPTVLRHVSDSPGAHMALAQMLTCSQQLLAVGEVLQLAAHPPQTEAAAAFFKTTGRPQAVLPWLLAVSQALLAVPERIRNAASHHLLNPGAPNPQDLYLNTLANYSAVVRTLLSLQPETYSDAVQQSPATQQAVLSVLLDRCLPALAAHASPETLADTSHTEFVLAACLGEAVGCRCLLSELARRLGQDGNTELVLQALFVLAALPLQPSPGAASPGAFGQQHMGAAVLLGHLCTSDAQAWPPATALACGVWPFVEAVPHIAAQLAAMAAGDGISAECLANVCFGLQMVATALINKPPIVSSASQLSAWAAALNAALRLVPVLLLLHKRCRGLSAIWLQHSPSMLSPHLLCLWNAANSAATHTIAQISGRRHPAADGRLARQLWALHTTMCRLVAWLAADPSDREIMLPVSTIPTTALVLETLSLLRAIIVLDGDRSLEAGLLSESCLHGMCVAHWVALQTAARALGGLSAPGCAAVVGQLVADFHSLAIMCKHLLMVPEFRALFSEAIGQMGLDMLQSADVTELVADVADKSPQLAVAMARSDTLQALVEGARRLLGSGDASGAAGVILVIKNTFACLDRSAEEATSASAQADALQLSLLQQQLQHVPRVSTGLECSQGAGRAALAEQLPQLSARLPAATKLANLLHDWWQPDMQPERYAEAQLALVQAAATRSCAYLRCANLGGEGGPAAGEGAGSQRCSACRAVWYCGTACSHADWREGGHRRECRALGAARRAAKELAAADAAEAAASAAAATEQE